MLLRIAALLTLVLAFPAPSSAVTISVPGDVPTIREAVDAALPGDTIEVAAGTYDERLRIEELDDLTVIGLPSGMGAKPVLRPDPGDDGVRVKDSSGVSVSGFRIESSEYGVRVEDSTNVSILDNEIDGAREGIRLNKGSGHVVDGNVITNVTRGRGIRVDKSASVTLSNNSASGTPQEGIRVIKSPSCSLVTNAVDGARRDGIRVVGAVGVLVDQNAASSNVRSGIRIETSSGATVSGNVADDNGEYGIRVKKSPPVAAVSDLLGAGNTASGNGIVDLRVDP